MADTNTGLLVKTKSTEQVRTQLVDSAGTNVASVSAAGRVSVDGSGVTQPVSIAGAPLSTSGGGTEATALRVTVATDSTGVLSVDDNGGSITVDGTVAATQSGTWNVTNISGTVSLPTGAATAANQTNVQVADNAAFTDGTTSLLMHGYIFDESAGTSLTENDAAAARVNANRAQVHVIEDGTTRGRWATVTASNAVKVDGSGVTQPVSISGNQATNIVQIGGATQSASNPLFTRLTDGTTALANLGQAAASAWFNKITDGTTVAGVISGTTALKVDIASVRGAVDAATQPLAVRLTDGSSFYTASSGTAAFTAPTTSTVTSSALGAGSSVDLDHTQITNGTTGQLIGADITASVAFKAIIKTVNSGGTATDRVVVFSNNLGLVQWRAPYKTFVTQAGAASNARFRVTVTNMDPSSAADVYSTAYWDQV